MSHKSMSPTLFVVSADRLAVLSVNLAKRTAEQLLLFIMAVAVVLVLMPTNYALKHARGKEPALTAWMLVLAAWPFWLLIALAGLWAPR